MPEKLSPPAKSLLTELRANLDHMPEATWNKTTPWLHLACAAGDRLAVLLDELADVADSLLARLLDGRSRPADAELVGRARCALGHRTAQARAESPPAGMKAKVTHAEYLDCRKLFGQRVPKDKIDYYRSLRCDVDDSGFIITVPAPWEVES